MAEHHTLTQLQYSKDSAGPFALYIYDVPGRSNYHSGKQWFAKTIRYPDEEMSINAARKRVEEAMAKGLEVRICDGGDMLVFHWVGGKQLYPEGDFWEGIS